MTKTINQEKLQELIKWSPFSPKKHLPQIEILKNLNKDKIVICAGTRGGKSAVAAYIALLEVLKTHRRAWVVSPTYDLSKKIYSYLALWLGNAFPEDIKKGIIRLSDRAGEMKIENYATGSWIEFKSADNPTSLLGEELDLAIIDECSRVKREIWESYISQRLSSRQGKAVFISTPFGRNWFFELYNKAKQRPEEFCYHFSTKDNPYFPLERWKKAKEEIPWRVFQQEYLAVFLADAAGVFREIKKCIAGEEEEPKNHLYTMGVDLGRYHDFTVICVVDRMTHHLVHFERFNQIDWTFQKKRIMSAAKRYNPDILIDSTAITVGDAYVRELEDADLSVKGYKIGSNVAKRQLIEKLSIFIDKTAITFPPIEVLIDELESFSYELTPSGNIRYEAPEGMFDDCVIALALAVWDLEEEPLSEFDTKERERDIIINRANYGWGKEFI